MYGPRVAARTTSTTTPATPTISLRRLLAAIRAHHDPGPWRPAVTLLALFGTWPLLGARSEESDRSFGFPVFPSNPLLGLTLRLSSTCRFLGSPPSGDPLRRPRPDDRTTFLQRRRGVASAFWRPVIPADIGRVDLDDHFPHWPGRGSVRRPAVSEGDEDEEMAVAIHRSDRHGDLWCLARSVLRHRQGQRLLRDDDGHEQCRPWFRRAVPCSSPPRYRHRRAPRWALSRGPV